MGNKALITLVLSIAFAASPIVGHSAEELFDTTAADAHMEKGLEFLKAKKYDAAIKELEDASSIRPEAESFYYLGYAYYMKSKTSDGGERKKAFENFNHAYELDPNFSPTRLRPAEAEVPAAKPETKAPEKLEKIIEKMETKETATAPSPQQQPQTSETATQPPQQPAEQPKQ